MSRRLARELALQALFQLDFNQVEPEEALNSVCAERTKVTSTAKTYAGELLHGTLAKKSEIDAIIGQASREWKVERMAGVDRNIVRLAIFEMNFGAEALNAGVVINEAVELAKSFGTDESSRFVNGILGSLVKKAQQ